MLLAAPDVAPAYLLRQGAYLKINLGGIYDGDPALIMFDPGHLLAVKGIVEQVAKKLIGKRSTKQSLTRLAYSG